jgi:TolB protein
LASVGLVNPSAAAVLPTAPFAMTPSVEAPIAMAASSTEEPASAIPWTEVGPGWFVALWSSQTPSGGDGPSPVGSQLHSSTLLLIDPLGGRYRVAVLPAPPYYGLLDWAGDGREL